MTRQLPELHFALRVASAPDYVHPNVVKLTDSKPSTSCASLQFPCGPSSQLYKRSKPCASLVSLISADADSCTQPAREGETASTPGLRWCTREGRIRPLLERFRHRGPPPLSANKMCATCFALSLLRIQVQHSQMRPLESCIAQI